MFLKNSMKVWKQCKILKEKKKLLSRNCVVLCKASRIYGVKAFRFQIALNSFKNETCTPMHSQPKLFPVCPYLMASIFWGYNLLYYTNKEEIYSPRSYLLLNKANCFPRNIMVFMTMCWWWGCFMIFTTAQHFRALSDFPEFYLFLRE